VEWRPAYHVQTEAVTRVASSPSQRAAISSMTPRLEAAIYVRARQVRTGAMYGLDSLPLSAALKARIMAWLQDYSAHAEPWSEKDSFEYAANEREARAIARLVKAELPDADVVALDSRVLADGSLGERVPYPGEHRIR
jgi:hypothetical protein